MMSLALLLVAMSLVHVMRPLPPAPPHRGARYALFLILGVLFIAKLVAIVMVRNATGSVPW